VKEGHLQVGDVRLHYLEWLPEGDAEDAPPLFLLHGLSSNAYYWQRLVTHLGHRRIVALDQRSHGLSDRPASGYTMTDMVSDAAKAIELLDLSQPVVVGHSWGAAVALELVGGTDGLASGLVFIDGPVMSMANVLTWDQAQSIMQPPLPRFLTFDAARAESVGDFKDAWGDDLEPFVRARVMADADAFVLTLTAPVRLEIIKGMYYGQPQLLWSALSVPATVLLASAGPAMISAWKRNGADELSIIAPNVDVQWYETPHDIPLYKPAEVANDVERICMLAAQATRASESASGD